LYQGIASWSYAALPRFVSGHRFSDAICRRRGSAALAAGVANPQRLKPLSYMPPTARLKARPDTKLV